MPLLYLTSDINILTRTTFRNDYYVLSFTLTLKGRKYVIWIYELRTFVVFIYISKVCLSTVRHIPTNFRLRRRYRGGAFRALSRGPVAGSASKSVYLFPLFPYYPDFPVSSCTSSKRFAHRLVRPHVEKLTVVRVRGLPVTAQIRQHPMAHFLKGPVQQPATSTLSNCSDERKNFLKRILSLNKFTRKIIYCIT